ncbi:hypothetical protein IWX78_002538 [Mycetocola sp. CAN_C7]|uniref:glycosyltransferase n=1 Tax=Mycetocola sp. CAN_C7 TaxID=2787724 RepID=UPI0018CA05EE
MTSSVVSLLATARADWSRRVRRFVGAVLERVPEKLEMRLNPAKFGFRETDIPAPPTAGHRGIRLYIAPVNFAGQGHSWARAAERLPGVTAVSMQYSSKKTYGFPVDNAVPVEVFSRSRRWQTAQHSAVTRGFTHVLIEAERSIFGALFDASLPREIADLRRRGLTVALVSHGSDLRLPSLHRERDEWSPFRDTSWSLVTELEDQAVRNRAILDTVGVPVFLSTPDLLRDYPTGRWLPVVIDCARWAEETAALNRSRPVVTHVPSSPRLKGSDLIDPVLRDLHDSGVIEYRRYDGVPATLMPSIYGSADIVLDQFRLGIYGVAACEALAAGRLVIGHVDGYSRDHVREFTGRGLPIVEATPATLAEVLLDVVARPAPYREIAREGIDFVRQVHDGRASAEALRSFLTPSRG